MESGFTDEAGVALAEALTLNKTLRSVALYRVVLTNIGDPNCQGRNAANFGAPAYEAFSADMLRINTSLKLKLPPLDTAGGDQRVLDSYKLTSKCVLSGT
jgi:hypothetical protein